MLLSTDKKNPVVAAIYSFVQHSKGPVVLFIDISQWQQHQDIFVHLAGTLHHPNAMVVVAHGSGSGALGNSQYSFLTQISSLETISFVPFSEEEAGTYTKTFFCESLWKSCASPEDMTKLKNIYKLQPQLVVTVCKENQHRSS